MFGPSVRPVRSVLLYDVGGNLKGGDVPVQFVRAVAHRVPVDLPLFDKGPASSYCKVGLSIKKSWSDLCAAESPFEHS